MTAAAPPLGLDHVVIGVGDLEGAASRLSAVLGRGPSWRGRHPSYGTENVLYRLDNAYLELLAPGAAVAVSTPWTDSLKAFLADNGDGLFALALSTPDIERSVELLRSRALPVETPAPGEGIDLIDGARRQWSNARVAIDASRGTPFFFIEHRSPREALKPAPLLSERRAAVVSVQALTIESADADGAARFWRETVGLPQATGSEPVRLELENEAALLLFAGGGQGAQSDRWHSLVLGVENISSVADRLDGAGIDFSQGDFREGYGLRLDVCGADLLLAALQ